MRFLQLSVLGHQGGNVLLALEKFRTDIVQGFSSVDKIGQQLSYARAFLLTEESSLLN